MESEKKTSAFLRLRKDNLEIPSEFLTGDGHSIQSETQPGHKKKLIVDDKLNGKELRRLDAIDDSSLVSNHQRSETFIEDGIKIDDQHSSSQSDSG